MSNLMFVLPFVATDSSLEVLYPSPLIDKGTIMHWEPSRSQLSSYGNGSVFEDVAADTSATILGASKSQLNSILSVPSVPAEFAVEKTSKGGLHVIVTQNTLAGLTSAGRKINLPLTSPVKAYIETNIVHKFQITFIGRFTRKPLNERPFFLIGTSGYAFNYYFYMRQVSYVGNSTSGPSANATYSPSAYPDVNTPFMFTVEVTAKIGTFDINTVTSGLFQGAFASGTHNGFSSFIMYDANITDLTISGKTSAQKRAEDLVTFNSMFALGGQYYGDTWTTPVI